MSEETAHLSWCDTCADEQSYEQPPCPDGHGTDCPEWFCLGCGYAVVLRSLPAAA